MKKFLLVLWLIVFCLSSLVASEKIQRFMYTWRCIFCDTIYMTSSGGIPDSDKCPDKDSFHTWKLERVDSLDDPPKEPEPA